MKPQYLADRTSCSLGADAMEPQIGGLVLSACLFEDASAKVTAGCTQAICISKTGRPAAMAKGGSNQNRRRGCRRARKLLWHFAWWHLLPHAPRKPKKSYLLIRRLWRNSRQPSTDCLSGRVRPAPVAPAAGLHGHREAGAC